MYQTILFDFDGTLVPSLGLWLRAFQYAISKFGREIPEQTIIDRFYYREYADVSLEFGFPSGDELRDYVHDGLTIAYESAELFEGARELIAAVRVAGMKTGLVTSSPRLQISTALVTLGMVDAFDTVVTGDDITHYKPHPEPVLLALSRLGQDPTQTLFVGDYIFDVLAGNAAGTTTALFLPDVHQRFYDFDKLRATGPDLVFSSYRDLAKHLGMS